MDDVYEICDRPWRGLGVIPGRRVPLAAEVGPVRRRAALWTLRSLGPRFVRECRSGDVLTGRIKPTECEHFGNRCTPESPLGAPMVSAEGACAAYYRYAAGRNGVKC